MVAGRQAPRRLIELAGPQPRRKTDVVWAELQRRSGGPGLAPKQAKLASDSGMSLGGNLGTAAVCNCLSELTRAHLKLALTVLCHFDRRCRVSATYSNRLRNLRLFKD